MSCVVNMYNFTVIQPQVADSASLLAAGETPFDALDLRSFSTFISRSVHLEALIMHHTGAPVLSSCACACVCVCLRVVLCKANVV